MVLVVCQVHQVNDQHFVKKIVVVFGNFVDGMLQLLACIEEQHVVRHCWVYVEIETVEIGDLQNHCRTELLTNGKNPEI